MCEAGENALCKEYRGSSLLARAFVARGQNGGTVTVGFERPRESPVI